MIASVQGKVADVRPDHVVVVVGGIGLKIFVALNSIAHTVGDEVYLHTLMIVREDAITLYGFNSTPDREIFERLISVNGVGPKMALGILGAMTVDRLRSAVAGGQVEAFTRVPGVGKKTAEKIIFELKDKLKGADGLIAASSYSDVNKDVMDALISFGYSVAEAQSALQSLPPDTANDFEERMRRALQYFV